MADQASKYFERILAQLQLSHFGATLIISQILAIAWWIVVLYLRTLNLLPVWYDQQTTFTKTLLHLADPYQIPRFANPPWTALPLAPFSLLPLPLAVLLQLCIYFAVLAGVIHRFGGAAKSVVITLTSFLAFDNALELNIEWLVCLGLLVPPILSGPLLLIKPQLALGYWAGLTRRELLYAMGVSLLLILARW